MYYQIGQLVAGLLVIALLAAIIEKLVCQRVFDDPLKGKITAVVAAWLFGSVVYGFGSADGGPFQTSGFVLYGLPALVILAWFIWRGLQLRREAEQEVSDTFE